MLNFCEFYEINKFSTLYGFHDVRKEHLKSHPCSPPCTSINLKWPSGEKIVYDQIDYWISNTL